MAEERIYNFVVAGYSHIGRRHCEVIGLFVILNRLLLIGGGMITLAEVVDN